MFLMWTCAEVSFQKIKGLLSRRRRLAVESAVLFTLILSTVLVLKLRHSSVLSMSKRALVDIGLVSYLSLETRPNNSIFRVENLPQPGQLANCSATRHNASVRALADAKHSKPESTDAVSTSAQCCPLWPPHIVPGVKKVHLKSISPPELKKTFWYIRQGGRWRPDHCSTNHRVALIVPYRDREEHLLIFLNHMHQFLQRQLLDYGIFIVEQAGDDPFNRAVLMNIGFLEANKQEDYQCCIFHDVDLLPQDDRNFYHCPVVPRHMSVLLDKYHYRSAYDDIFGGVTALSNEHFRLLNGFSNTYAGWGGEDDDFLKRALEKKLEVARYPYKVTTYTMLRHEHGNENSFRFDLLAKSDLLQDFDGLSNLEYEVVRLELKRLYTRILVKFDQDKLQRMYRFLKHVQDKTAKKDSRPSRPHRK